LRLIDSEKLVGTFLADDFPFLPSQILASAFPALDCSGRVTHSTLSTDLHVEAVLLSKRLLEGIHYRQIRHSPYTKA
jgi:predicted oxidoreductase